MERARDNEDDIALDMEEIAKALQRAVTLIGQAINATNFFRRRSILSALRVNESTSSTWIRTDFTEELSNSGEELFGKTPSKMSKKAKTEIKSIKQLILPFQGTLKKLSSQQK